MAGVQATLTVDTGSRRYPIFIGEKLLSDESLFAPYCADRQVLVISNAPIAEHYLPKLAPWLMQAGNSLIEIPTGETHKTLSTCEMIWQKLLAAGFNRHCLLVALGGGIVGDITGFAAACYQRGVDFIQLPTSLLAQVDSSVGGKTGVNHPLGKNMIGAFHQPQMVAIDIETLTTLPKREFRAGLAEVIKMALLFDADFFDWLETNIEAILMLDKASLVHLIRQSVQLKVNIVAQDEKEKGCRALLNLGHTYGHAIEHCQGFGKVLHGEAVAIGCLLACYFSEQELGLDPSLRKRLQRLLYQCDLPRELPLGTNGSKMLETMKRDKKNSQDNINLVLLDALASARIYPCSDLALIQRHIDEYRLI